MRLTSIEHKNDSFRKNWRAKNFGKLLGMLQNVIEQSFINWPVLPLVKMNTCMWDIV
jgi:hypothetical protein